MSHKTVDPVVVLSQWDNGGVVEELNTDQTIFAIAKRLKLDYDDVLAVLVAAGRID